MIQKITKIICDNCKMGISDWLVDLTYKEIAEICKEENIAIVRYIAGRRQPYIFCNEECFEKWAEEHGYDPILNKYRK